ncbi:MAG: bifunctional 5,10-methylene-tetrahydrofolate dehydrogenase/5,10-methylene-tetrahydrofolate cyclohydrolase, partial [Chloroflexaceae bacterium]|nr:bifunctional 5,10-methylene-tetrahydrofolate dehydrogenase/5,10-methylene-tetrahydrofolate cyclohydrolase [Chloroflexaceae bacterium]
MPAILLDGKALAQEVRAAARQEIADLTAEIGRPPTLAVIQVAGDPASTRYVRSIEKCVLPRRAFSARSLARRGKQCRSADGYRR